MCDKAWHLIYFPFTFAISMKDTVQSQNVVLSLNKLGFVYLLSCSLKGMYTSMIEYSCPHFPWAELKICLPLKMEHMGTYHINLQLTHMYSFCNM